MVIVIQENRSPDNLFYADQNLVSYGAHVHPINPLCFGTSTPLTGVTLGAFCFDPDHSHIRPGIGKFPYPPTWSNEYDSGKMDGACTNYVDCEYCPGGTKTSCPSPTAVPPNPQYTYASNSDGVLSPYFQIAEQYGFANYMFQTNQGPSFPAHQFLFSGTSAPEQYNTNDSFYQWFAAENELPPWRPLAVRRLLPQTIQSMRCRLTLRVTNRQNSQWISTIAIPAIATPLWPPCSTPAIQESPGDIIRRTLVFGTHLSASMTSVNPRPLSVPVASVPARIG